VNASKQRPTQRTETSPLSNDEEDLFTSDSAAGEPDEAVAVQVDDEFAERVDAADLIAAVSAALEAEERPGEVTVVITTDEAVADLNRQYRDTEGPTDVLSFPAQDPTPGFVSAPEMATYHGDIIIALPFTERQAAALNRLLRDELRLLAVHGTLHLLGYDHAEPDEEAEMWARQDAILASLP
jgi:probable rRNA maturation factor